MPLHGMHWDRILRNEGTWGIAARKVLTNSNLPEFARHTQVTIFKFLPFSDDGAEQGWIIP